MTLSPRLSRAVASILVLVLALGVGACGTGTGNAAAKKIKPLGADIVPAEMVGLRVTPEDTKVVNSTDDPFVEAVGLYGLRKGDLLQATLQVSRFTAEANVKSSRFRTQVVQQIGSSEPKTYRMGEQTVYLTTGLRQSVAVWFKGRHLFVLSSRQDFNQPRTLLRAAIEQVNP